MGGLYNEEKPFGGGDIGWDMIGASKLKSGNNNFSTLVFHVWCEESRFDYDIE